jgi:lysophospholipase L1-like esterase
VLAALVLSLTLGVAGCSADGSTSQAEDDPAPGEGSPSRPEKPQISSYVALGDSYTAAPFVPDTQLAGGCFRSTGNYPTLLAARLGAHLKDVSCGGADTADLAGSQKVSYGDQENVVPPQLKALRPDIDLVTVGIGGNDEGLFRTLVQDCTTVAGPPGASCRSIVRDSNGSTEAVMTKIERRVADVLAQVHRKAPDALVVLVGYPRLVAKHRQCPAMPVVKEDVPVVAGLETQLNQALSRAADDADASYVDMHAASVGHEICSEDPWVNGKATDEKRALAFHPFAEGEQAIADQVFRVVSRVP